MNKVAAVNLLAAAALALSAAINYPSPASLLFGLAAAFFLATSMLWVGRT